MDRRSFVTVTAAALAAQACNNVLDTGNLGVVGAGAHTIPLMGVGATVAIDGVGLGGYGVAVTRLSPTNVIAVSRVCTHAACEVNLPASPGQNMVCPCHGSVFTTGGAVVQGPAGAPLTTYSATIDAATSTVVVTVS
jgi:Rieske Fe-S protein